MLDPALLQQELLSDGELGADEFALATAIALRDGGQWGQAYPEPLFDGVFDVLRWRKIGERHLRLELGLEGKRLNAIQFGGWGGDVPPPRVRIAYRLAPDDYRGGEAIQLVVTHLEPAPGDGNC
jgi:single-stranded-DNA-specific exonuclease